MTRLTARYPGQCLCGCKVLRGDSIDYDRARRQIVGCSHCNKRANPDPTDLAYEDQCAAACGLDRYG